MRWEIVEEDFVGRVKVVLRIASVMKPNTRDTAIMDAR